MGTAERFPAVRRGILGWYRANGRTFPWRVTRDPYRILVSEIMLQQTQADRVAVLYPRFLSKYPTVDELSDAARADVVRSWKGLGYNNRAVRLHAAVREIRTGYGGRVPAEIEELRALPGIGKYTSHAVACFAYGRRTPLVDVNVRRVLSRIFHKTTGPAGLLDDAEAWRLAGRVLPRDAYSWNQALMEFGSRVCTARTPRCDACPVKGSCASASSLRAGVPETGRRAGRAPQSTPPSAPEPAHLGVPRRIWRGRIVEHLRGTGRGVRFETLQRAVRPGGKSASARWLGCILGRLEKDGLVTLRGRGPRAIVTLAS